LVASFIVAHVYLTTTGPEPLTGIEAMIIGWEDVEVAGEHALGETAGETAGEKPATPIPGLGEAAPAGID
jgi:hypothetical protein